jgi:hypothetical protein
VAVIPILFGVGDAAILAGLAALFFRARMGRSRYYFAGALAAYFVAITLGSF